MKATTQNFLVMLTSVFLLAGCTSPKHRAPVEERTTSTRPAPATPTASPAGSVPIRSVEPRVAVTVTDDGAPRPGTYVVKPGDTLIRIALEHGQNWRDVARWSGLENPNLIEVGQVLRVAAPAPEPGSAVSQAVSPAARAETRPLVPGGTAAGATGGTVAGAGTPGSVPGATTGAPTAASGAGATPSPSPAPAKEPDDDLNWMWPAAGPVLASFDEGKTKGVVIGGKAGDPVLASADGRVVYAGSGLRGYGNLVIVKHNNTFLTAYAHNQALVVKEDQVVRRGQKIAEMGSSDADRVQLHFEVRRQGKPVDPTRYLPPR
jgi:lipoprotein NlpD